MAITAAQVPFTRLHGARLSGSLHELFGPGVIGTATEYAWLECRNESSLTLFAVKLWTSQDQQGGGWAGALGNPTTVPNVSGWTLPDPTTLVYTEAVSKAAGLALPDIPPGSKVLLCARRSLIVGTAAYPVVDRLVIGGTSPI